MAMASNNPTKVYMQLNQEIKPNQTKQTVSLYHNSYSYEK